MGNDKGFTFIEVIISLALLSMLLLGFDALNLHSLRTAQFIWQQHLAQLERENKVERKYANHTGSRGLSKTLDPAPEACAG